MSEYKFRGLEMHGTNMWHMAAVNRSIEFIKEYHLNALIFHDIDIVDKLIPPFSMFPKNVWLDRWPLRDITLLNNRYYINQVAHKCVENGIDFYFNVKELFFPVDLLEIYPHLRKENGAICPTDPFWWDFLDKKYTELCELVPEFTGVIVSPGTRESMVSMAANACTCERCRSYNMDTWYRELLTAMYKSLKKFGKKLVVRDFAYTSDHQYAMVEAAQSVSKDIVMALKKTPHDYYPTFPDNPAIGNCGGLDEWIEFDTWGQYFGVGVFPCSLVEDTKRRLKLYAEKGATGAWFRTDWELLSEGSTFNSFNMLNLIAGAMITENPDVSEDEIYSTWVNKCGLYNSFIQDCIVQLPEYPTAPDAVERLKLFTQTSWKVLEKTIYARGHVFQENCQFFDEVDLAFNMMQRFHSRDYWDPDAHLLVDPTEENMIEIFREKDEALELVRQLPDILKPETLGVSKEFEEYLKTLLDLYDLYVRTFREIAHLVYYTRRAEITGAEADAKRVRDSIKMLEPLRDEVKAKVWHKPYAHEVVWCLDYTKLDALMADASSLTEKAVGV